MGTKVPGYERSQERKFPGTFVPRERKGLGTKVPGNFRSPRTKVPGNEWSRERKFLELSFLENESRDLSFLGTKGLGYEKSVIRTDDGTPGGRYATGHCLRATDTRRDTGPWRCSSDGTDDETFNCPSLWLVITFLTLRFVHH